jgi:abortive infection bacteriophage resistance protein
MKYTKLPITIPEQIQKLKSRGLLFSDETKAAHYLSNISYYRIRAYTYPFQDNVNPDHPFIKRVSFEEIIQLYVFDRQLRFLIFNAIEKIEIAFRTQVIYHFASTYGAYWHLNPALYNNSVYFAEQIASLNKEIDRSNETFIKHYKATYTDPKEPPCWMSLEVSSMGLLSKIFYNLKNDKCKDEITKHFGLKNVNVLENWMQCFSLLRNICAHHGRVWNRRMTKLSLPHKTLFLYVSDKNILPYKLYAYLTAIQYVLNIISPGHDFKHKFRELMTRCPLLQEKEMGFPINWQNESLWH